MRNLLNENQKEQKKKGTLPRTNLSNVPIVQKVVIYANENLTIVELEDLI